MIDLPQDDDDVHHECRAEIAALTAEIARLKGEVADKDRQFLAHAKWVSEFLNELYAIMIDPLAEGEIKVGAMTDQLLEQAKRDRESLADLAQIRSQLEEAEKRAEAGFIDGLKTAAGIAMGFRGHLASHVYDAIRLDIAKAKMISDNAAKEIRND